MMFPLGNEPKWRAGEEPLRCDAKPDGIADLDRMLTRAIELLREVDCVMTWPKIRDFLSDIELKNRNLGGAHDRDQQVQST